MPVTITGVDKALSAIDEKVRKKHVSVMLFLDRNLVKATPEDTGRAKSNWIASIGSPSRLKLNTGKLTKKTKKKKMYKPTDNSGAIGAIKPFSVSYISNNMPYIVRLNNGWSRKNKSINWVGEIAKRAAKL